jgi:Sec-independent protein translocase protein TatA
VDVGLLLIVLLIAAFVWRGPKTLPQLGRMFGEGIRAVRREVQHDGDAGTPDGDTPDETRPGDR